MKELTLSGKRTVCFLRLLGRMGKIKIDLEFRKLGFSFLSSLESKEEAGLNIFC